VADGANEASGTGRRRAVITALAVLILVAIGVAVFGTGGSDGDDSEGATAASGTDPEAGVGSDEPADGSATDPDDAGEEDATPSPRAEAGDPPPPQEWELTEPLTDPIEEGVAAVEARPEEGLAAYRAAVREAAPATREVPDALLDDYPETICVVAEEDPAALEEVVEALRGSGQIDPDLASFLTGAAVAAVCPSHLDALPEA
jgi:hypothetical protein